MTMQIKPRELLRQQLVLKKLGYYTGPLDGVWGPNSIDAMRKFETRVDKFRPAHQTGGLPLPVSGPLPKGFWMDRGLLCFDDLTHVSTSEELAVEPSLQQRTERRRNVKKDAAAEQESKVVPDTQSSGKQVMHNQGKHQKHQGHNQQQKPQPINVSVSSNEDQRQSAVEDEDADDE